MHFALFCFVLYLKTNTRTAARIRFALIRMNMNMLTSFHINLMFILIAKCILTFFILFVVDSRMHGFVLTFMNGLIHLEGAPHSFTY